MPFKPSHLATSWLKELVEALRLNARALGLGGQQRLTSEIGFVASSLRCEAGLRFRGFGFRCEACAGALWVACMACKL